MSLLLKIPKRRQCPKTTHKTQRQHAWLPTADLPRGWEDIYTRKFLQKQELFVLLLLITSTMVTHGHRKHAWQIPALYTHRVSSFSIVMWGTWRVWGWGGVQPPPHPPSVAKKHLSPYLHTFKNNEILLSQVSGTPLYKNLFCFALFCFNKKVYFQHSQ